MRPPTAPPASLTTRCAPVLSRAARAARSPRISASKSAFSRSRWVTEQAVRRAFVHRELAPWDRPGGPCRRCLDGRKGSAAPWTMSVGTVKAAMSARRSVSALTRAMARMACGEAHWNSPMAHCTHAGLTGPSGPPAPKNAGAMAARSAGRSRRRPATKGSYTTSRSLPSGLPSALSRHGVFVATSTVRATRPVPCRDR